MHRIILASAALLLLALLPTAASAQDEKLGTLGRSYIRQAMAVQTCTTIADCSRKMTLTIKTAGSLADRATKLMKQGDTACMAPALRFGHVYTAQMQPAIKGWMRSPGTFEGKKRFMDAAINVARTLPNLYHKC